MKRIWSMTAALLLCATATFAQFTNILENGSSQTISTPVDATGTNVFVGNATSTNSMTIVGGGSLTNDNAFVGASPGASSNTVSVSGNGASWINQGTLSIGAVSNSAGNSVTVDGGGTVSASNLVIQAGNGFNLDAGGTLEVVGGFDYAAQTNLNWNAGGTLSIGGTLSGLDALDGNQRTLVLSGGTWDLTGTDLYITGTNNVLSIADGGTATNASAYIGNSTNDYGNAVLVGGSGSVWAVTGNLVAGNNGSTGNTVGAANQGRIEIGQDLVVNAGNTLSLSSTGMVVVAGDMLVSNAVVSGSGTVEFGTNVNVFTIHGTNSQISTGILFDGGGGALDEVRLIDNELVVGGSLTNRFVNFETLSFSNSTLSGFGTLDGFQNVNVSGGRIKPTGQLTVDGNFSASDTILEVVAGTGSLHTTNSLDVSSMGAQVAIPKGLAPLGLTNAVLIADGGVVNEFDAAATGITEHYLLYDFNFDYSAGTNVSVVSTPVKDGEISPLPAYAAVQGIRGGFNGMQSEVLVRTRQLRRNLVATAHAIPQEAFLLGSTNAPAGARGPGDNNTIFGMHFWAKQFSGMGKYDRQAASEGYDLKNSGTAMGLDKLIGEALVAGINYTYARSRSSASDGSHVETETYWLGLYGEYVTETGFFADALAALAWSKYDSERLATGYRGLADYRGRNAGGHIDIGNYYHYENWALAPYAGLHYLWINADGHTETEVNGNRITVGESSVSSLESALGLKLRNRIDTGVGRFQTTGYAEWMYDFLNEDIDSSLSDGAITVKTAAAAPGRNLLNAGIGVGWMGTDSMEIGIGYDVRLNDEYKEHMGTMSLNIMF